MKQDTFVTVPTHVLHGLLLAADSGQDEAEDCGRPLSHACLDALQYANTSGLRELVMCLHGSERSGGVLRTSPATYHGLDNPTHVYFYEPEYYPLSNFSAFAIWWMDPRTKESLQFHTAEAVYHWERFAIAEPVDMLRQPRNMVLRQPSNTVLRHRIRNAPSAHEAFQLARANLVHQRPDWDLVKVEVMRLILLEKVRQHEYVRRKLLATGDRTLVENSWRDDFWGWGANHDGRNQLGVLWMEIRAELRKAGHE
jgi:ribA/ribD-fused uncharacterized protein